MNDTKPKHSASNQLFRGEVHDFLKAMSLVQYACDVEGGDVFKAYKAVARKCDTEYRWRIICAEQALAEEWIKSPDEDVRRIGEALKSGNYEGLAI